MKDILKNTSKSVDQVTIQPDGKWELHGKTEPVRRPNGFASDEDDDLIEITESGSSVKASTPRPYSTPLSGLGQSQTQTPAPVSTNKRPIAAVIDLTSSGDEDDQPLVRAPKRQFSGYPEPSPTVFKPGLPPNGYPRP